MNILKSLRQNNHTISYITSDSTMKAQLQQVANDDSQKGQDIAVSILLQIFGTAYMEPIEGIEMQTRMLMIKPTPENVHKIALFPNPNNGQMQLTYQLNDKETGELIISDVTGRLIKKMNLINGQNILPIDISTSDAGVYLYEVLVNGQSVKKDKLVIVK